MNTIIQNIEGIGKGFLKFWNDGDIDLFFKALLNPVITITPLAVVNKILEFLLITVIFLIMFLTVAYVSFTAVSSFLNFMGDFFIYSLVGFGVLFGLVLLYKKFSN